MKFILNILFLMVINSFFGQEWRDSLIIARKAYANKEYMKSFNDYKSIQQKVPDNIQLYDELAQSAYKSGDFETSEKLYQQGAASKKSALDRASNAYNIGNARMKSKNYEGAIEAYKNALRINSNDDKARYNLSKAIRELKKKKEKNKEDKEDREDREEREQEQQSQNQDEQSQGSKQQENKNNPKNSKSKLSTQTAKRMLDKLMKEETETKRKLHNGQRLNSPSKSGKDW